MKRSQYLAKVRHHDKRRHGEQSPKNSLLRGLLGANTEAAELAALLFEVPDPHAVLDECGDVLFNLVRCLDAVGFTLADCMAYSAAKNDSREQHGKDKRREKALIREMFPR